MPDRAHDLSSPSRWVTRFSALVVAGGRVLDVACGVGRHARYFGARGCRVVAVDRDAQALDALRGAPGVEVICADIESGAWPLEGETFDAVVVTNYLWRPLLPRLAGSLRPGAVLIYETFALGNERYGRPRNPDFLLRPNELLEWLQPQLQVVAFEAGQVSDPAPAVIQRICAVRADSGWAALDAGSESRGWVV